jgi:hypothetical protein
VPLRGKAAVLEEMTAFARRVTGLAPAAGRD